MLREVVEAAAQELERLLVEPASCTRQCAVRAGQSNCEACARACPRGAIRLDPLGVDPHACDRCGLCIAACPAGALSASPTARRDMLDGWKKIVPREPYVVACGLAQGDVASIRVGCLGETAWEAMVVPLLVGVSRVELRSGRCQECTLSSAEPRIEAHLEMAARVARPLGLRPPERRITPRGEATAKRTDPVADKSLSRRGLFRSAVRRGKGVATHVGAALVDRIEGEQPVERGGAPSGAAWLRDLLASLLARLGIDAARVDGSPFAARPETLRDKCVPCPVCETACPMGALSHIRQGDRAGLWVSPERCTACGVCVAACPERALRLEPDIDLAEWGGGEARLASPRNLACRRCGAEPLTPSLGLCATCYRTNGPRAS